jgi:hypothetical protein
VGKILLVFRIRLLVAVHCIADGQPVPYRSKETNTVQQTAWLLRIMVTGMILRAVLQRVPAAAKGAHSTAGRLEISLSGLASAPKEEARRSLGALAAVRQQGRAVVKTSL